jgi:D-arabinose 1-dehydrogenase-like Zn-dependent alcohol dehydrogenase
MKDKKNNKLLTFLTNCRRILSCYSYQSLELLAVKNYFFNRVLTQMRRIYYVKAVKIADVKSTDKVLFIGSGILPSQCIIIAEETGANVLGIDNSKKAVDLSIKYINKIGLSNKIYIKHGEGEKIPAKDFQVVFIAINVWPINNILKNLAKNLKKNAKILYKSYNDDISQILVNEKLNNVFEVKDKIVNPLTQSHLLIKKQ